MYVIEAGSSLKFLPSDTISPADFISIILTALGVILAAMAIMLGLVAVVGWSSIRTMIESRSDEVSRDYLKNRFSDKNEQYLQFVEDVKEDVRIRILPLSRQEPIENLAEDPDA